MPTLATGDSSNTASSNNNNNNDSSHSGEEKPPNNGLTKWKAIAIVVNFVSGGYVLLPYVFAQAGILLSAVVFALVSFQTFVSSGFLLEAGARAEYLARLGASATTQKDKEDQREYPEDDETEPCLYQFEEDAAAALADDASGDEAVDIVYPPNNDGPTATSRIAMMGGDASDEAQEDGDDDDAAAEEMLIPAIAQRKHEITTLNNIFLGRKIAAIFTLTILGDILGVLWLYGIVFASALSEWVDLAPPSGNYNYMSWLALYSVVVLPLSCLNLLDQLFIQYLFLAGRIVMVLLMIATMILQLMDSSNAHFEDFLVDDGLRTFTLGADWRHLVLLFQTCVLSTAYQGGVPAIAAARRNKGKRLPRVFRGASTVVYLSNAILSILVVVTFGSDNVLPSANLLWTSFVGSLANHGGAARFISTYVSLFAAVDGLAIFPLLTATLGDILIGSVFGERASEVEKNGKIRAAFRLAGGIPPLLGAFVIQDLSIVATYSGVFTLLSYTALPSLLWLVSGNIMRSRGLEERTVYSAELWLVNTKVGAYLFLAISVVAIVAVVISPILNR